MNMAEARPTPPQEHVAQAPVQPDKIKPIIPEAPRYRIPLSELVSTVVNSNPDQYLQLLRATHKDFRLKDLLDVPQKEDMEKSLNDEANFQFSAKHRPLAEAVLNGIDTEHRREYKTGQPVTKSVDVEISDTGFSVRDHGEGMNLDTVMTRLLVPKLTGNSVDKTDVVGRFGVGFYSLIGYVKEAGETTFI